MANRSTTTSNNSLLKNKLSVIMKELNRDFLSEKPETAEDILKKFNSTVQEYFDTLLDPIFKNRKMQQGRYPLLFSLNQNNFEISQDLDVIYLELEAIKEQLISAFNCSKLEEERVKGLIQSLSGDLEEYRISKAEGIASGLSDTFRNNKKIETQEKYYSAKKCFIDEDGRGITLPVSKKNDYKILRLWVGDGSNGIPGNNHQIGSATNDRLSRIFDGRPDSCYEYEKVFTGRETQPLLLELDIELEEPKIMNFLRVDPVIFPGGSSCTIVKLLGSIDDKLYKDLMPDCLANKRQNSKGLDEITLTSETGEPKTIWFSPNKVKYLKIAFFEDSSFLIKTTSGIKNRLAIGLKEVTVGGTSFSKKGEMITTTYSPGQEIKYFSIKAEKNIPEGFAQKIDCYFSSDDGGTWTPLAPLNTEGVTENKTVLRINDGSPEEIKTETPVQSFRLKFGLERIEEESESKKIEKECLSTSEFVSISPGTKELTLKEAPHNLLEIFNVGFGSRGGGSSFVVPSSIISSFETYTVVSLPEEPFNHNSFSKNDLVLFADGRKWKRYEGLDLIPDSEYGYVFDNINNQIYFSKQKRIPVGKIHIHFLPERVKIESGEKDEIIPKFQTDNVIESMSLYRLSDALKSREIQLRTSASVHDLGIQNIEEITIVKDVNSSLANSKEFINGFIELVSEGDYSVDLVKGKIYTRNVLLANEQVIVNAKYRTKENVELLFEDGLLYSKKKLEVKQSRFVAETDAVFEINLDKKNIIRNSLVVLNGPLIDSNKIEWEEGRIRLETAYSGKIEIQFDYYDYFLEYNICSRIEETDITSTGTTITLSDRYVLKYAYDPDLGIDNYNLFKVSYNYLKEKEESIKEYFPYVTPILSSYSIFIR